jgi:hypothetical protein
MIVVLLDERGVQKGTFEAKGGPLEDPAILLWLTVQGELFRLDDAVKKAMASLAAKLAGGLQAKGSNKV